MHWLISVAHHTFVSKYPPSGYCCDTITLSSPTVLGYEISGTYLLHPTFGFASGGQPVYERTDGVYCIMFVNNWKVEVCNHPDKGGAIGFLHVSPDIQPHCPTDVGARCRTRAYITWSPRWHMYGDSAIRPEVSLSCPGIFSLNYCMLTLDI